MQPYQYTTIGDMADFQFDLDELNLNLDQFPDWTQPDCTFEFPYNSLFPADFRGITNQVQSASYAYASSSGLSGREPAILPAPNQLAGSHMQTIDPKWTVTGSQGPTTRRVLPAIPSTWRPCSPPHSSRLSNSTSPAPPKPFQYPDPEDSLSSGPVPYSTLPPLRMPLANSSPSPTSSPHKVSSLNTRPDQKRKRSIHLSDLYASDEEAEFYASDSSTLSSAPPFPSGSVPVTFTKYGTKKGRKPTLEQTERRKAINERRRRYYNNIKQDQERRAKQNTSSDLYTFDEGSDFHSSDSSNLSSAPSSPSGHVPVTFTKNGIKKGRKYKLEQTESRKTTNERRRRYYKRVKQDPERVAKRNAAERQRYAQRRTATLSPIAGNSDADMSQTSTLASTPLETQKLPTPTRSTASSQKPKPKPKWKGWVELAGDDTEEELSDSDNETSSPSTKKRKLTQTIEESSDDDSDEEVITMSRSQKCTYGEEGWVRRSGRAKNTVNYKEGEL